MDQNDFNRMMGVPDAKSLCITLFKQIRREREIWMDMYPKLESGEIEWGEEQFARLVNSSHVALNAAQAAIQFIYVTQTGVPLDNFEADDPRG